MPQASVNGVTLDYDEQGQGSAPRRQARATG